MHPLDAPPQAVHDFYKKNGFHLPIEVYERVVDMWKSIRENGNALVSEETVADFISERQKSS